MCRLHRILDTLTSVLLLFGSGDAAAQVVLGIQPSVRAAGMGYASNAVFWGGDPDYWVNPALLGYHRGIRFDHTRHQMVPELFDHIFFSADRLSVGACGVGISLIGEPFDWFGGTEVDFGEIPIVEEGPGGGGVQVGSIRAVEVANSISIGVNLLQASNKLLGADRRCLQNLGRYSEISVGLARKAYSSNAGIDPSIALSGSDGLKATAYDLGAVVRLTPYNSLDYEGYLPWLDTRLKPLLGGFRFDLCYGFSRQNFNDPKFRYQGSTVFQIEADDARTGLALSGAVGLPAAVEDFLDNLGLRILSESLTPLVSWGHTRDDTEWGDNSGWELDVAGIFSLRRGRIDEPGYDVQGETSGWGVGFRLADIGGFRVDRATVPQSSVLDDIDRKAYTLFVDPIELWRLID